MITRQEIALTEYQTLELPQESLSSELAEQLWRNYKAQVSIESPTFITNWKWLLTNQGWVGYIPVSSDLLITLKPRVAIENIFRMLEYAYNLKSMHFLREQVHCESLQDFFNILAGILAKRILTRTKKGLYKAYRDENERLSYVCGRIDVNQQLKSPWSPKLPCHYQDCTPDIADNQILLWTLYNIIRSGLCRDENLQLVHRAFRSVQKVAHMVPFTARQCTGRYYNRLNLDYQPMHNLCWFFLEHSGPQFATGKQMMIPFMVNMPRLYELFVAQWLKVNLPEELELKFQEKVQINASTMLYFNIDLVIYDKQTEEALYVLDTKYKIGDSVSPDDFAQIVTYALAKKCPEAVLVYPGEFGNQFSGYINNIRVRSLPFRVDYDIEETGQEFVGELLKDYG